MSQEFIVEAEPRLPSSSKLRFLVQSATHRTAWKDAREVARTGRGALMRVGEDLQPWPIPAGEYTVKRVLSTAAHRRGRPPKITTDDLLSLAERRGVRVAPRFQKVIDELNQA